MKKNLVITMVLMITLTAIPSVAQEEIVISGIAGSVTHKSLSEVLKEAYKRIGITMIYKVNPSARSLLLANNGTVDGEVSRVPAMMKQYTNLRVVPVNLHTSRVSALSADKKISIDGWGTLKPYRIGHITGLKLIEAKTQDMRVTAATNYDQLFRMLDAERLDIVVGIRMDALQSFTKLRNAKEIQLKEILVLEPPLHIVENIHLLHKKHEDLIPKLTSVLQEMEKEGQIKKILDDFEANYLR